MSSSNYFSRKVMVPFASTAAALGLAMPSVSNGKQDMTSTLCENNPLLAQQQAGISAIPAWKYQLPLELRTRVWLTKVNVVTTTLLPPPDESEEPLEESGPSKALLASTDDNDNDTSDEHLTEVFIIGVHHLSPKSSDHVSLLLNAVSPDDIFLEVSEEELYDPPLDVWEQLAHGLPMREILSSLVHGLVLRLCSYHGVEIGGGFNAAFEYARTKQGKKPPIWFADRPWLLALKRFKDSKAGKLLEQPFELCYCEDAPYNFDAGHKAAAAERSDRMMDEAWENRTSILSFLIQAAVCNEDELMGSSEIYTPEQKIQFQLGDRDRIFEQERDIYMATKIIQHCRDKRPRRVVAIVSASHLKGMENLLHSHIIGSDVTPETLLRALLISQSVERDSGIVMENIVYQKGITFTPNED